MPPFALRPTMPNVPPFQPTMNHPSRKTTSPLQSPHTPLPANHSSDMFTLSPLHSSSSSDESYLNLGTIPDTLDPFSRFWGMLDNMLDDISNPVAFASAPLGLEPEVQGLGIGGKKDKDRIKGKEREGRKTPKGNGQLQRFMTRVGS